MTEPHVMELALQVGPQPPHLAGSEVEAATEEVRRFQRRLVSPLWRTVDSDAYKKGFRRSPPVKQHHRQLGAAPASSSRGQPSRPPPAAPMRSFTEFISDVIVPIPVQIPHDEYNYQRSATSQSFHSTSKLAYVQLPSLPQSDSDLVSTVRPRTTPFNKPVTLCGERYTVTPIYGPTPKPLMSGRSRPRTVQQARFDDGSVALGRCRLLKRASEVLPHRVDRMYYMSGSGLSPDRKFESTDGSHSERYRQITDAMRRGEVHLEPLKKIVSSQAAVKFQTQPFEVSYRQERIVRSRAAAAAVTAADLTDIGGSGSERNEPGEAADNRAGGSDFFLTQGSMAAAPDRVADEALRAEPDHPEFMLGTGATDEATAEAGDGDAAKEVNAPDSADAENAEVPGEDEDLKTSFAFESNAAYRTDVLEANGDTEESDAAGATEEPDALEATEEPDAAEATEEPDALETTEESDAAGATEEPDALDATEEPDAAEATEEPDALETTEESDAAGTTEEPDALEATEESDAAGATEEPGTLEAIEEPDALEATEEPDALEAAEESDAAGATEEPDAVKATEEPDALGASNEEDAIDATDEPDTLEAYDSLQEAEVPEDAENKEVPDTLETTEYAPESVDAAASTTSSNEVSQIAFKESKAAGFDTVDSVQQTAKPAPALPEPLRVTAAGGSKKPAGAASLGAPPKVTSGVRGAASGPVAKSPAAGKSASQTASAARHEPHGPGPLPRAQQVRTSRQDAQKLQTLVTSPMQVRFKQQGVARHMSVESQSRISDILASKSRARRREGGGDSMSDSEDEESDDADDDDEEEDDEDISETDLMNMLEKGDIKLPYDKSVFNGLKYREKDMNQMADKRVEFREVTKHLVVKQEISGKDTNEVLHIEPNMTPEQAEAFVKLFDELDVNKDGRIAMEEVQKKLDIFKSKKKTDVKKFIRVFDLNGDRTVDVREFLAVAALNDSLCKQKTTDPKADWNLNLELCSYYITVYKEMFEMADQSRNGKLGLEELMIIVAASLDTESGANIDMMEDILNSIDRDRSGEIDFVEYLTYIPVFLKLHQFLLKKPMLVEDLEKARRLIKKSLSSKRK